jgi:transposase
MSDQAKSTKDTTAPAVTIDLVALRALVARAQPLLSVDDAALLAGTVEQVAQLYDLLHQRTATLARLRRLFHLSTSEKLAAVFPGDATSSQTSNSPETPQTDPSSEGAAAAEGEAAPAAEVEPPPRKGKNKGRVPASKYPRAKKIKVPHENLRAGGLCPGCVDGKLCARKEPRRIIGIDGSPSLVATCWELERLRCCSCGETYTASAPPEAVEAESEKYSPSAAAMIAFQHYSAGMAFHRLAKMQDNLQTPVPSSTQWDVVRKQAAALLPVHEVLLDYAAQTRLLHADDTHVRITSLMGKRRAKAVASNTLESPERTGLFTTSVIATYESHQIALFFSGRQHAGENLEDLLEHRPKVLEHPVLMSDALSRNVPKVGPVIEANCLAHGRRNIVDEAENFPKECKHLLDQLALVFGHDAEARRQKMSDQKRLVHLQRSAGPVLGKLRQWMVRQFRERRIEENSGLGVAIRYLLKHWKKLTLFLRRPGVPLTNNISERALKMIILHRKNSYFFRSLEGARVADIYTSLIHTAQLAGINPVEYLTELLRHPLEVAESPADWVPWRFADTLAALRAPGAAA